MVNMDDPRHARLRRIVSRAFSPRLLARPAGRHRGRARAIVDDVLAAGRRDFVTEVAARMPIQVICDMMGIPEQAGQVHAALDVSTAYTGVRPACRALRLAGQNMLALLALHRLVIARGRRRRADPTDDLISALVTADVDGDRLNSRELGSFFSCCWWPGNETTRNTIAHGLKLLTDHPEQRELLLADFDARIGGAIEEMVRYVSPIIQFRRTLTRDHELRGPQLPAGRQGRALLRLGQPRRGGLPRPGPLRHHPRRPTRTSASAAPARTSASAPTWPGARWT